MQILDKFRDWYHGLPDKKRYLEFITALLTIPVLLTVIISNVRNINQNQKQPTPTPSGPATPQVTVLPIEIRNPTGIQTGSSPSPTGKTVEPCLKEIGPVEIKSPREGESVTGDPVCIEIKPAGGDYCASVWSYRINNSPWSEYTDRSICLYNQTGGEKTLEVRFKSIVTGAEQVIRRVFNIVPSNPTPATGSAGM